jgi:hypothetical protein
MINRKCKFKNKQASKVALISDGFGNAAAASAFFG